MAIQARGPQLNPGAPQIPTSVSQLGPRPVHEYDPELLARRKAAKAAELELSGGGFSDLLSQALRKKEFAMPTMRGQGHAATAPHPLEFLAAAMQRHEGQTEYDTAVGERKAARGAAGDLDAVELEMGLNKARSESLQAVYDKDRNRVAAQEFQVAQNKITADAKIKAAKDKRAVEALDIVGQPIGMIKAKTKNSPMEVIQVGRTKSGKYIDMATREEVDMADLRRRDFRTETDAQQVEMAALKLDNQQTLAEFNRNLKLDDLAFKPEEFMNKDGKTKKLAWTKDGRLIDPATGAKIGDPDSWTTVDNLNAQRKLKIEKDANLTGMERMTLAKTQVAVDHISEVSGLINGLNEEDYNKLNEHFTVQRAFVEQLTPDKFKEWLKGMLADNQELPQSVRDILAKLTFMEARRVKEFYGATIPGGEEGMSLLWRPMASGIALDGLVDRLNAMADDAPGVMNAYNNNYGTDFKLQGSETRALTQAQRALDIEEAKLQKMQQDKNATKPLLPSQAGPVRGTAFPQATNAVQTGGQGVDRTLNPGLAKARSQTIERTRVDSGDFGQEAKDYQAQADPNLPILSGEFGLKGIMAQLQKEKDAKEKAALLKTLRARGL